MQISMPKPPARSRLRALAVPALILAAAAVAALFWHLSGRVAFTGRVESPVLVFSPDIAGTVAKVFVAEGDAVNPGQEMLRLEDADLRAALAREREKLAVLEAALPPERMRSEPSTTDPEGRESRDQRLARLTGGEEEARLAMQEASAAEAKDAFAYNRAKILAAQGKTTPAERENARRAHEAAAQRLDAAKKAFERQSLARAATEAEMRRALETRQRPGTDETPANVRIAAFESQLAATRQAAAELAAAVLRAPMAGVVAGVAVHPGDTVAPGQPVLHVFPAGAPVTVAARVDEADAAKLQRGQICTVTVLSSSQGPFTGYIRSVLPRVAPPGMNATARAEFDRQRMQVRILLDPPQNPSASPLILPDLAPAEITVHLRQPLRGETQPKASPAVTPEAPAEVPGDAAVKRNAPEAPPAPSAGP